MRWICVLGLFIGYIEIFWWRKYQKEALIQMHSMKNIYFWDPLCMKVGERFVKDDHMRRMQIRNLYPLSNMGEILSKQRLISGRWILGAWMGVCLLGFIFSFAFPQQRRILDQASIERSVDDGINETVAVSVQGENFEIDGFYIEVRDQLLEGERREVLFIESEQIIRDLLKGDNDSLDCVNQKLNLVSKVPGSSMEVVWNLDDADYVYADGSIDPSQIPQQGIAQTLHAALHYGEESRSFDIQIFLCPIEKTIGQMAREEIENYLESENDPENNHAQLRLPDDVLGQSVLWTEKAAYTGEKLLLMIVIIVICAALYYRSLPRQNLEKRQMQIVSDYPKFIHKIVLLTEAGMNMRSALEVIVEGQKHNSEEKVHYVYKEVDVILRMMQSGISETKAYEYFGKNCGDSMYVKLSMLMIQWVKKGAAGTGELMQGMAQEAMLLRRDHIRQQGEKIGTKLLLPMGLILVVVFMILVVPAFLSLEL